MLITDTAVVTTTVLAELSANMVDHGASRQRRPAGTGREPS